MDLEIPPWNSAFSNF